MNNWITTTLLATVAATGSITEAKGTNSEAAFRQRIEAFRNAGDARDAATMGKLLHKDFRLIAYFGDAAEGMEMNKTAYVGALLAGKIGGVKRELSIVSTEIRGNHAVCKLRMQSNALRFENYMQWVMTAEGWQLLNDLTHAVPVK
jgi:Putative lumazine-binding